MLTRDLYEKACSEALGYLQKAGIVVTEEERKNMEVVEYGLDNLYSIGLELVVYVNTERCCAKELILFPHQTCPEHRHPPVGNEAGKEETFRCRWGKVYLYVSGDPADHLKAVVPEDRKQFFTAMHEIELKPGDQFTIRPNTLHWFQAGPEGAVVSEFSTKSRDELDIYTDPDINPAIERKV